MSEDTERTLLVPEPTLDLKAAVAVQQAYLDACKALLDDSDYVDIRGKRFRKRSGWAKLRRVFCVSCEVVSENKIRIGDDWGCAFVIRARLPNGRFEDSEGTCMASEFASQSIAPTLSNVRAKALTRGKSRATSDLLGAGVVSAEEVDSEGPHWIDNDQARTRFWSWAKGTLKLTEDQIHEVLQVESVKDFKGTMSMAKLALEAFAIDGAD